MVSFSTIARCLALALLCAACSDDGEHDRRNLDSIDTSSDSARDSSLSSPPPQGEPAPFDSSYEHYIQKTPGEELDSMPKTPQ
jgi:hypothetical protein